MSRHHQQHHHSRIHRSDARRAAAGVILLLVLLVGGSFLVGYWEDHAFRVDAPSSGDSDLTASRTITIDGKTYRQRGSVESYLFLGIDVEGTAKAVDGYYGGGQADVQMLLILDHENRTWQLLQLNRDTMAEVPIIGIKGDVVGTKYEQIALSHSYGNGMEESCRNSVKTVSNLLWGQKIYGYFSLHMDGVALLNDAVGGVPVKITTDFTAVDKSLPLGETITLDGEQALTFVRSRLGVDDQTNTARMARQKIYLESLSKKIGSLSQEALLSAYDTAGEYIVTDLGSQTLLDLSDCLESYQQLELLTIDGEAVVEDDHWAYYLDKQSLQDTILKTFYRIEE